MTFDKRTPRGSGDHLQTGERVFLRHAMVRDREEFLSLMRASGRLHAGWVSPPLTLAQFDEYLRRSRRPDSACYFVCRVEDEKIAGVFNLNQIVRGNFASAYMSYYAGESFAGRGLMSEALRLVLREAFGTLKLHRLEANIQPGNRASIAMVERAGFTCEGFSRRYLKISGRWRDHERWAILAEDWRVARR